MTVILKGKPVAENIYAKIRNELNNFTNQPKLIIIIIGEDPASEFYVKNLEKKGKQIGIIVQTVRYQKDISQKEFLQKIDELNNDKTVSGMIIQKPLPEHLDNDSIILAIDPAKDMDAFHPINMGKLMLGQDGYLPSTPAAVLEMIRYYQIDTVGKNIVILGRSNNVGKPLANLLLGKSRTGDATITVCHSRTRNLAEITKKAEILIAAIGKAEFVKAEMIKEKSIVIDVGVNLTTGVEKAAKYVGDVDYQGCFDKASMITPVPGGVGSVTTAMLLNNVLKAFKKAT